MLLGVAFFSYIISNFIEIISSYEQKVGIVDQRDELNVWLTSLQRFKNRQPLAKSLQVLIERDFNHFWVHDKMQTFNSNDIHLKLLPESIKSELLSNYLFNDIFRAFRRFFEVNTHE